MRVFCLALVQSAKPHEWKCAVRATQIGYVFQQVVALAQYAAVENPVEWEFAKVYVPQRRKPRQSRQAGNSVR
jgi:hypothetical protein